uniref:Uncharacterized protein n=1 Tax=Lotharella globosa TaxID=91324 RepID=A0A7S3YVA4_9EUKA
MAAQRKRREEMIEKEKKWMEKREMKPALSFDNYDPIAEEEEKRTLFPDSGSDALENQDKRIEEALNNLTEYRKTHPPYPTCYGGLLGIAKPLPGVKFEPRRKVIPSYDNLTDSFDLDEKMLENTDIIFELEGEAKAYEEKRSMEKKMRQIDEVLGSSDSGRTPPPDPDEYLQQETDPLLQPQRGEVLDDGIGQDDLDMYNDNL